MSADHINDGGPAFPVAEDHKVAADIPWTCGMTLRDYFAAKALAGSVAGMGIDLNGQRFPCGDAAELALLSYQLADAMLKARQA